ncbi:MAG TPA: NAD(+) diphosphatase [Solirubrobacteraceae bacterium]|nr:NAD(+) diphosphatase [Solirubrobacteraceae bacterium]
MSTAADRPAVPPFTGMALDRASTERKDPEWVRAQLAEPGSRVIAAGSDGLLVADGDAPELVRLAVDNDEIAEPILLGLEGGDAVFGLDVEALAPDARRVAIDGHRFMSLREAGTEMAPAEAGLAAYVMAMLNWHRRHRFCANCGNPTDVVEGGYERRCPRCGAHHFPRTDPVVIMTVEYDDQLLLGRRTGWPEGRLSVLAGFVSPGESAEEAVSREVQEESGIVARDPVFVASQPWPFPASLMLGFHAVSDGGEPRATDGELDEVHWLSRDAIVEAINGGDPGFQLPGSVSIARFLIDRWAQALK